MKLGTDRGPKKGFIQHNHELFGLTAPPLVRRDVPVAEREGVSQRGSLQPAKCDMEPWFRADRKLQLIFLIQNHIKKNLGFSD